MLNIDDFNDDIKNAIWGYLSGDRRNLEDLYLYSYAPEIAEQLQFKKGKEYSPTLDEIRENIPFFSGNKWNVGWGDLTDEGIYRILKGIKYKYKDLDIDKSSALSDRLNGLKKFLEDNRHAEDKLDEKYYQAYKKTPAVRLQRERYNKQHNEAAQYLNKQFPSYTPPDVREPQNRWEDSEYPVLSNLPAYIPSNNLTKKERESIIADLNAEYDTLERNAKEREIAEFDKYKYLNNILDEYHKTDTEYQKVAKKLGWSI